MVDGYLRYPDINGDLVAFVAEDDVWVAPPAGGRAWRVSADHVPVSRPRLSPDGRHVAWTRRHGGDGEIYLAPVDGGPSRRITYWGGSGTRLLGWADDGRILAASSAGQPFSHFTWPYAVPLDGGPPVRLPYGPVDDLARAGGRTALLTGGTQEYARWKRYRGGRTGRIWIMDEPAHEDDGRPVRILADLQGTFGAVMLVADRVAVLSDHDGVGELYSCRADGTDLRRHTEHDGRGFYARQASTDGRRVVFQRFGELWLLDDLFGSARPLQVRLGGARRARRPHLVTATHGFGDLSCDHEGRASAIEVGGTVHWLTHRDGPARVLLADPMVRARLPRVLGRTGKVVWVTDAEGVDALQVVSATGGTSNTAANATSNTASGLAPNPTSDPASDPASDPVSDPASAGGSDNPHGRPDGAADTEPRLLASGLLGRIDDLAAAPDGTTVAVATGDGRLLLVDVASAEVHELAASDDGPVCDLNFSPDSGWLAWSHPGPRPLRRIRLARLTDRTVIDVTDVRFRDTNPVFTLDSRYLAFLSLRSFDPVYDAHTFDLSFPYGCRPYLVPLAATTPSPFAPMVDGRAVGDESDRGGSDGVAVADADANEGDAGRGDGGSPVGGTVDIEGLADRVVSLPVEEARYFGLRAVQGGLAWLYQRLSGVLGEDGIVPGTGRSRVSLERFAFDKRTCETLVDELTSFEVSGDGKQLVVCDHGRIRVRPSGRRADGDELIDVDLSRARTVADPAARWRHAYAEVGRVFRHEFWRPDMGGVDWDGVLERYRPALDRIAGPDDFADLLWEVFGELETSHAYVRGARYDQAGEGVGLLGADLQPTDDGRDGVRGHAGRSDADPAGGEWRVTRVLPGESSDPRARSPLAAPGVAIRSGDTIVAIDGRPMDRAFGPAPALVGTADKPVELTVRRGGAGKPRRVAMVPLADDVRLRYHDWVAGRRQRVRELGDHRIGYLHIPDMVAVGWAQFHRDLRIEMALDALIVDLRDNGGGHVSELVVEKLARRVIGWDVPRGMRPSSYPQDAPRGPVLAVIDEHAASDGDIIAAAIRTLGIGRLVGTRTWGGVIGIAGSHHLVDGTAFTVPKHATWFAGVDWGLENRGVDPDVEVVPTPRDWAEGRDPQLETAVALALEELRIRPPVRPPPAVDPR